MPRAATTKKKNAKNASVVLTEAAIVAKKDRIAKHIKVPKSASFSIVPPEGSVRTETPKGKAMPTERGLYHFTIRDVISWLMSGQLVPYDNNRGGFGIHKPKVNPKKIKHIADNFRIDSIGELTYHVAQDGTAKLCDFHNRGMGILCRYFDGRAKEEELNEKISVRVVEDHVQTYADLGLCSPATARERIENMDLCFGRILDEQLYPVLSENAEAQVRKNRNFLNPIGTCLYALAHKDPNDPAQWVFGEVYSCRTVATAWQYAPAVKGFECLDEDVKKLAGIIEEYFEFVKCYHADQDNGIAKQIDKIVGSSAFIFFFLFDKLSGESRITTPKVLANRCVNNMTALHNLIQFLMNGGKEQQNDKFYSLYKTLKL